MTHAIRIGVGLVEAAGYTPNAVLLNPADFAALDINAYDRTPTRARSGAPPSGA